MENAKFNQMEQTDKYRNDFNFAALAMEVKRTIKSVVMKRVNS